MRYAVIFVLLYARSTYPQVHILTANGNNGRTNANLLETVLSPATVRANTFGKLGTFDVDAQVYAQPLYVSNLALPGWGRRNVLFIATMNNTVYAFDADEVSSPKVYWQVNLGTPIPAAQVFGQYGDVSYDVGILGTGVIDIQRCVLYVVAEVYEGGVPAFYLHGLDLATGAERMNGPVALTAALPGSGSEAVSDGTVPFDPRQHIQRPGLLLVNNSIYVSFGSHADQYPYHGWMLVYDTSDLSHQTGAFLSTPSGNGGSFWQAGRGPAADREGNIYAVTGNGDYDGVSNFGQSFVKLSVGGPKVLGWFTPAEWKSMSDNDFDLTGPALIRNTHTLVGADKLGNLYVMDGDAMGAADTGQVIAASAGSIFAFAVWNRGDSAYVYTQGGREPLKCFQITGKSANPDPVSVGLTPLQYSRIGMTISANGSDVTSGILWESTGDYNQWNVPGVLHAYDASNLAKEVWNSEMRSERDRMPPVVKFVPPTVANGKVYVPSPVGVITVYGLLPPVIDVGHGEIRQIP